jgi:acyl-CoA thioester hydrolase
VEVRWSDEDGFGHVNNAAFLTYAEEGRDRLLAAVLGDDTVWDLVIVRVEVDYRVEVTHRDEAVYVDVEIVGFGRSSVRSREVISRPDGTVAAELATVSVARDREAGGSRPWRASERQALAAATATTSRP